MKKRVTAGLLIVCMAGSLLAGCGSSATSKSAATDTTVTTEAYVENYYDTEAGCAESVYDDVSVWEENTEEYGRFLETGFQSVRKEPLSTFSADVDTASYSNLRRMIESGYGIEDIPEGAVRIEEIINYFSYEDLKEPEKNEPFGVTTQIMPCPWNEETELLRIGLKTEEIDYKDMPSSNLVFLLDVSGSMYADDKLPLLQESFAMLAENLTEKDRVSIITYAGDDTIVIEGVSGNNTKKICEALYSLEAGGSTHGSKGIETAYRLAEDYYIKGGNNRIILATDGDLNVGLTTEEELEDLITEKKETGIFLSVLGFGTGNIKDNKMEILADKGNGNYAYIDSKKEANKVLVEEMGATLLTICKDVKIQVEFNPAVVEEYRLIGYENRRLNPEDFADDKKDAGEIGSGHCVTALYEIVTRKEQGTDREETDGRKLKYAKEHEEVYSEEIDNEEIYGQQTAPAADGYKDEEWLTVGIRYKEPDGKESRLLEYPVDGASYTKQPSGDFLFSAAAAEFGLAAMDSEYKENASLEHVKEVLKSIDLEDEYKEEFYDLVKQLVRNS